MAESDSKLVQHGLRGIAIRLDSTEVFEGRVRGHGLFGIDTRLLFAYASSMFRRTLVEYCLQHWGL
jgi:hypothetical protein